MRLRSKEHCLEKAKERNQRAMPRKKSNIWDKSSDDGSSLVCPEMPGQGMYLKILQCSEPSVGLGPSPKRGQCWFNFGALYPCKSGLITKHIVKHSGVIVVSLIFAGSVFAVCSRSERCISLTWSLPPLQRQKLDSGAGPLPVINQYRYRYQNRYRRRCTGTDSTQS